MKRSDIFVLSGVVFIGASLGCSLLPADICLSAAFVLAAAATALIVVARMRKSVPSAFRPFAAAGILVAAGAIACTLSSGQSYLVELPALALNGNYHRLEVKVTSVEQQGEYYTRLRGRLLSAGGTRLFGRVSCAVTLSDVEIPLPGDRIYFTGFVGESANMDYNRSEHVLLDITLEPNERYAIRRAGNFAPERLLDGLRRAIGGGFARYLGGDSLEVVTALFLGDSTGVPREMKTAFIRTGTSHLLAVSGMHLAILAGLLMSALNAMTVDRRFAGAAVIVLAAGYVALTGFSPSAIRSWMMLTLAVAAQLAGFRYGPLQGLALAGWLICLYDIRLAANLSFLLSYTATMGIILSAGAVERLREIIGRGNIFARLTGGIAASLVTTLAAILFTLPVAALAFGGVSVISPLANLAISPVIDFALCLCPALAVFGWIRPLAGGISVLLDFAVRVSAHVLKFLGSFDWSYVSARHNAGWIFAFAALSLATGVWLTARGRKARLAVRMLGGAAALSVGVTLAMGWALRGEVAVDYRVRGSSQAVIFYYDNFLRADIADISSGGAAQGYALVSALEDAGAYAVDSVIVARMNPGQAAMLAVLLRSLPVEKICLPAEALGGEYLSSRERISSLASRAGCAILYYTRRPITGGAEIKVIEAPNSSGMQTAVEFKVNGYRGAYLTRGDQTAYGGMLHSFYDLVIQGSYGSDGKNRGVSRVFALDRFITSLVKAGDTAERPPYVRADMAEYLSLSGVGCLTLPPDGGVRIRIRRNGRAEYRMVD